MIYPLLWGSKCLQPPGDAVVVEVLLQDTIVEATSRIHLAQHLYKKAKKKNERSGNLIHNKLGMK